MKIDETDADELVFRANARIRELVESGEAQLSSEATYRSAFAWELGRLLNFSPEYRFDVEYPAFDDLDTDDRFLDLLTYTDPQGRVPALVEKRNGAFFRLVKCTTSRPSWQAATGGTRHGQTYQEASSGARAGANLAG